MNGPEQQQREAAMTLRLPDQRLDHWRDRLPDLLSRCSQPIVDLDCGDWVLTCSDLADLCATRINRLTGTEPGQGRTSLDHSQWDLSQRSWG